MARDYLPLSDERLPMWGENFVTKVRAAPMHDGLSEAQVADLEATLAAYVAAVETARNPVTRTALAICRKRIVKSAFIVAVRRAARLIQANPATMDERRFALGLTVPKSPAPIPPPAEAPRLHVVSVSGRTIQLVLHDAVGRARKPAGVVEARLYSCSGAHPAPQADWRFEAAPTRAHARLTLDRAPAGVSLWLAACWVNPRGQAGPMSAPIRTALQVAADPAELGAAGTRRAA